MQCGSPSAIFASLVVQQIDAPNAFACGRDVAPGSAGRGGAGVEQHVCAWQAERCPFQRLHSLCREQLVRADLVMCATAKLLASHVCTRNPLEAPIGMWAAAGCNRASQCNAPAQSRETFPIRLPIFMCALGCWARRRAQADCATHDRSQFTVMVGHNGRARVWTNLRTPYRVERTLRII